MIQQNKQQLVDFQIAEEKSCETLTDLATLIFKKPISTLTQVFDEVDLAKTFGILLGKVFKEILKISDDFIQLLDTKNSNSEYDNNTATKILAVIYNALSFISIFGHLLDYLVYDNYKFESIIEKFAQQKVLLKLVLSIMLEATKIQALERQLRQIYLQRKIMKSNDERIILNFAKILFNLIISPNNMLKQQFIEEQGIYILKKILKKSYTEEELEIYFYCLGIIPPIILTYPKQQQEFFEHGYGQLLSEHLLDFYEQAEYLHISSPLLQAIRALISKSEEMKKEFISQEKNLDILFEVASRAYGDNRLKNIYISAIILMCESGFQQIQDTIVKNRFDELKKEYGSNSEEPGAQIKLKEYTNRLQSKVDRFVQYQQDYKIHQEALQKLRSSIFDDSELEKCLLNLNKIWNKSPITKSFFITSYGNLDSIMQCLKNLDENVMLNSCDCLLTILYTEEGAQDLFLRHKGIHALKNCLQDFQIDIKKRSLSILCLLVKHREEAKMEILENGVLEQCIQHIDKYPEDDIDHEILCHSLDLIAEAVPQQPLIQSLILNKEGLNKIVMQLKLVIDQLQKKPDYNTQIQLKILDKLCLTIISIISRNPQTQDMLRTDLQIFNPLVNFLSRSIQNLNQNALYNEYTICNTLNLISNAIDTNKQNQEFFLKNFKPYDLLKQLLHSQSLRIAGLSALLLSHLTWTNVDGQALFSTREVLKRLVFLMDFNQLINESEAESSIENLMEVSFYTLLAVINLSHENLICQQLVNKMGGLQVIVKLLKSPSFDAKKTACLCLNNLINSNQENIQELVSVGGVAVLINLINDEEDDDLSTKAYQCLDSMGSAAVVEIVKQLNGLLQTRENMWKYRDTIMIDVFMNRERHIFCKPYSEQDETPNNRDFGPQDREDLMDLKSQEQLEKLLPVLNGLVYNKQENRDVLLKEPEHMRKLFEIFRYQLPIELHENALYALLNLVIEAKKSFKGQIITQGYLIHLFTFLRDLHDLEFNVLRQGEKFAIVDYGIKVNYNLEANLMKKQEMTIEEMQPTILDARVFEYINSTDQMFFIDQSDKSKRTIVEGRAFEGQGLKKSQVIKHLEELRSLGYSIINNLVMGNAKLALNIVQGTFPQLAKMLMKDVMIMPNVIQQRSDQNAEKKEVNSQKVYSETLWDEGLDFMLNLVTIQQVYEQFQQQAGMDLDYLENLKTFCEQYQVQSRSTSDQQKGKTIIGKLTQVINEIKQLN